MIGQVAPRRWNEEGDPVHSLELKQRRKGQSGRLWEQAFWYAKEMDVASSAPVLKISPMSPIGEPRCLLGNGQDLKNIFCYGVIGIAEPVPFGEGICGDPGVIDPPVGGEWFDISLGVREVRTL
ncbi:hypothetical protein NDU88_006954 [Pleurodeles waltl]|uniref:Uncharacterized protein n=1 Tax=Pleurodeles waltl TaxID=8319 RepID=A0AAV7NRV3_PLEWA|nr:hypothetical protein NDU88_006954 [Pleurodeles waltl]